MEQGSWPSYHLLENRKTALLETVNDLENQFNQLVAVSQAMWELLKRETQLTEADLKEQLQIVLARKEQQSALCPYCHRSISLRTGKCLYCNATIERGVFDDLYLRY